MRFRPSLLSSSVLVVALVTPRTGRAEDDVAKDAARNLAYEGIELYEKGDHSGALDKLERASVLVKAPTLALWRARALEKLGRWLDADAAYAEAVGFELPEAADSAWVEARAAAKAERSALDGRIPKIVIAVRGAPTAEVRAWVGARELEAASLGGELRVDPGEHRVRVEARGRQSERVVRLLPGETRRLDFTFDVAPRRSPPTTPARKTPGDPPDSGQRVAGWIAIGAGGAGLLTGVGTGLYALRERSDLDGVCSGGGCPPSESARVDRYNAMLTVSTVGFVVGAAGTAVGVTLLLTAPRNDRPTVGLRLTTRQVSLRTEW